MGRAVLVVGAALWAVAAAAGLAVSAIGVDRLTDLLPPLAIDDDALRGALVAVAVCLVVASVLHVAVLVGLTRGSHAARSAAILLSATALAVFTALAAAAFASAAAEPSLAGPLLAAGAGLLLVSAAYASAAVAFVREIRARGPS